MVFYFSGTGNSKWVAEKLATLIDDEVVNIVDVVNEKRSYHFNQSQTVGIVFPVYAWSVPPIVLDFLQHLHPNGAYTFAICTCGDECGYTMQKLSRKIHLDSVFSIIMPNNYIIGYNVDHEVLAQKKINQANVKIPEICKVVQAKKKAFVIDKGRYALIKSTLVAWVFNHFMRSTKKFYVKENCISCGLCKKVCTAKTISFVEGKPVWDKKCNRCLACIHRCPERAIQYGKHTESKGRYFMSKGVSYHD